MFNWRICSYSLILSAILLVTNTTSVCAQNNNSQENEAKKVINLVIGAERGFYIELKKFANNFNDLNGYVEPNLILFSDSYQYKLNVLDNETLVQTIAIPTELTGFRTYTGAVSFNNGSLNSIFCQSAIAAQIMVNKIQLVDNKLECPTGFEIVITDVQKNALFAVSYINGWQKDYFLGNSKFAKSKNNFQSTFPFSNTDYNYQINLLENGKIAQVQATPNFKDLKSYIGGTLRVDDSFESLVCASKQPTKHISQSIELIDGKLGCPSKFEIVIDNVQQDALFAVDAINSWQEIYSSKAAKFTNDLDDLADIIELLNTYYNYKLYYDYKLDLLENDQLAQVVATPKLDNLKSYIGGTLNLNFNGFFLHRFVQSVVCGSEQPTKENPQSIKIIDDKFQCPTGFQVVSFTLPYTNVENNVENEASKIITAISYEQQAYFLKNRNFSENQNDLRFLNTYYDYNTSLLENGKFAQVTAIPKFDDLKSYIGGTFYLNGFIELFVCVSEQPTQNISQSIEIVDGKLQCPTGFIRIFFGGEQDVLSTIETTNKAQQAYFRKTSKFTNDQEDLNIFLGSDYYDYSFELSNNGTLSKVIAIPRFNNLKIYAGTVYNNNGKLQLISCASKQSKYDSIPPSIPAPTELIDGKLCCSTDFEEVSSSESNKIP